MNLMYLKRDWLVMAAQWRSAAERWSAAEHATPEDRQREYDNYMKWSHDAEIQAEAAPVKIELTYADGRVEVYE